MFYKRANSTAFTGMLISPEKDSAGGLDEYPHKHGVSGSELLKGDFIRLKDTPGNLSLQASQALPQQGYEMLHYTVPSSACVAYRMNFNDNLTFSGGAEKCFKRMESTDPS